MTGHEFRERYSYVEQLKLAHEIAKHITIRSYVNGNSRDTTRETTKAEEEIIFNIADAALSTYEFDENNWDGILTMAEFSIKRFLGIEVNSYDTIYTPLRNVTETWLN